MMTAIKGSIIKLLLAIQRRYLPSSPSGTIMSGEIMTYPRIQDLNPRAVEARAMRKLEWGMDDYTAAVLQAASEMLDED